MEYTFLIEDGDFILEYQGVRLILNRDEAFILADRINTELLSTATTDEQICQTCHRTIGGMYRRAVTGIHVH